MDYLEKKSSTTVRNKLSKVHANPQPEREKWSVPGNLYQNIFGKNDDYSSDDSIRSESTLEESDRSIQSVNNSAANSLSYSEDDTSDKSIISSSITSAENSVLDDRKQSQNLHPRPVFMNVDVIEMHVHSGVRSYSHLVSDDSLSESSSACDTKECSLTTLSVDHYFQSSPVDPSSMLSDWASNDDNTDSESENYIFADDDDVRKDFVVRSKEDDDPCAASEGVEIPTRWRQLGRNSNEVFRNFSVDQVILDRASRATSKSSSSSFSDNNREIDFHTTCLFGPRLSMREIRLDKDSRKRIVSDSLSPLDKFYCCCDFSNRYASKYTVFESERLSAVIRNEVVHFSSWENSLLDQYSLPADDQRLTAIAGDDNSPSQLNTNSFVTKSPLMNSAETANDELNLFSFGRKLEEARTTSEQIAKSLNIEKKGNDLLRRARKKQDFHFSSMNNPHQVKDESILKVVTFVNLFGNIWMPQYEDYVAQSVKSFANSIGFGDSKKTTTVATAR